MIDPSVLAASTSLRESVHLGGVNLDLGLLPLDPRLVQVELGGLGVHLSDESFDLCLEDLDPVPVHVGFDLGRLHFGGVHLDQLFHPLDLDPVEIGVGPVYIRRHLGGRYLGLVELGFPDLSPDEGLKDHRLGLVGFEPRLIFGKGSIEYGDGYLAGPLWYRSSVAPRRWRS